MLWLRLPATQFLCYFCLSTRGGLPRRFLSVTILEAWTTGSSQINVLSIHGEKGVCWEQGVRTDLLLHVGLLHLMVRGQDYGNEVMIWMELSWWMRHFYLDLITTGSFNNNNRSFSLFCSKLWLWLQFIPITCLFHAGKNSFSYFFPHLPCSMLRGAVLFALLGWQPLYGHPAFERSADWRVMEPVNFFKKRGRLLC